MPHPRRRVRGSYALRYVTSVDLERCRRAWELTGGIEAVDEIVVTDADEAGWLHGRPVWRVSGLRQGTMADDRKARFVVRAADGTPSNEDDDRPEDGGAAV